MAEKYPGFSIPDSYSKCCLQAELFNSNSKFVSLEEMYFKSVTIRILADADLSDYTEERVIGSGTLALYMYER